jgi:CSLREA domain-containing protein
MRSPANALDAAPRLPGCRGGGAGRSRRRRFALTGVIAAFVLSALLGLNAAVASTGVTFVVNDTADRVDSNSGDGQCRSAAGTCTLRAAIQQTNRLSGADTIVIPAGTYALEIPPLNQNLDDNGDLDITDSLTISGAGAGVTFVDGGTPPAGAPPKVRGLDRLFEVVADGREVTFSGLTIGEGYAAEYGGAIANNSTATVSIAASTLTGNVAEKAGGALDNHFGGAMHVRDSTLTNNVAFESGSALNNNRDGALTVTNSTILSNTAGDVGLDEALVGAGAIANNAELDARGTITVTGSQIGDNASGGSRSGAAISNDGAGTVTVDTTTFTKNRSSVDGGALFNGAGVMTVTGSTFTENLADNGGAIYNSAKDGSLTVRGSTFSLNEALARGGAIASGGTGSLMIADSTFSKNSAEGWGGAVVNDDKGSATILNSTFTENSGLNGGGFGNEGDGPVVVENSTFRKNSAFVNAVLASGEGGGMQSNSGGPVAITGGAFTENTARDGGGFGNEGGGEVTITGTRFSANRAEEKGGGILIQSGTVRMLDIDVIGNFADAAIEAGGGIAYEGDKLVSVGEAAAIENSRILDNTAKGQGGGIDSRGDGPLDIATTRIAGNTAAMGGGIHHVGDAPLDLIRSTLSGNSAESGGGLFTDGDGETGIENSTVSGNRAGQFGGGLLVSSRLNIRSSTVAGNNAASGGGINNGGGDLVGDGTVFLLNTIVANNPTGGNCAGTMTSLGGNLDSANTCALTELSDHPGTDPRLGPLADNFGPTQTHALLAESPAQENAVCTELVPCPPVDQRGVERPRFDDFDIGAYESELTPGGGGEQRCAGRTERPVPADVDSWVSQSVPAANFGNDSILKVKSLPGVNQRALVHFALPPAPPGCHLVSAKLRLFSSAANVDRTLEAVRVASGWSELGVTWANQPAAAGPAATAASGLGSLEWDVLAQTRDMYTLGSHGFLIRDGAENESGEQSFHGTEKGLDGRPELVLVFDDPDAPPAPDVCPTTPQILHADSDSWVSEGSPTNNFGTDSTLKVKSQVASNARALVSFPLPALPPGCTSIGSAILRLDASSAKDGHVLEARRIASPWSELGVTWSNQPGTTGAAASIPSLEGLLEWTVTEQVLDMYVEANHGFLIRDAEENGVGDEQTISGRLKLNDGSPELVLVFDDSTPETTIDPGPVSPTNATGATFELSSDRADATFECSLDGAPFQACTSPHAIAGLSEGDHRLEVRSTRKVRAVDPTPASYEWTVDVTAPEAAIEAGPADPTNETAAGIAFSGSDNLDELGQLSFQCRLDSALESDWGDCSSPAQYADLGAGVHRFQVRASDRAGNVGAPVEHAWTIDLTDPETAIGARPADPSNSSSASFELAGSDNLDELAQLRFQCRLDSALDTAWEDCSSPKDYRDLAEGRHTVEVRAIDRAGNVDASPDAYSWTVDVTAPGAKIVSGPADPTKDTSASLAFTGSDNHDALGQLRYQCRLDGGDYGDCSSPQPYELLAEGSHTFEVRATDRAGNTGEAASYTWNVDVTAPAAEITAAPADPSKESTASLAFAATDNHDALGQLSFQCRLDAGAYADCESPQRYELLTEGSHTFEVRATDRAGNVGEAASYSWTVDLTAPDSAIGARPADPSNSASASVGLTGSDNLDELSQLRFQCRLDSAADTAWEDCSSPKDYRDLAEGRHTVEVRAIDRAGNVDASPDSYTWAVDLTAPETAITAGPADPTNDSSASLAFTGSDSLDSLAELSFQCRLDSALESDYGDCSSPKRYELLTEGTHTFEVRATDRAGNVGEAASYTWTVDVSAPASEIVDGPPDPSDKSEAALSFTGSDNLGALDQLSFQCRLDSALESDYGDCSSPQPYELLAEGRHTFEVRATDRAGNVGEAASYSWTIDLTAPESAIGTRPADPTNSRAASFGLTGSDNHSAVEALSFQCRLDSELEANWADCSSPAQYADLGEGKHSFQVRAIDEAGNVDASPDSYTWAVDLTAPETAITAGPADPTSDTSASLAFTGSDNLDALGQLRFQCRLDAEAVFAPCSSPKEYVLLAEGLHTFEVRTVDRAGNAGAPASYSWTIDFTGPETTIGDRPADPTSSSSASLSFAGSDNLDNAGQLAFQCRLDPALESDYGDCSSPAEYADLAAGRHTFEVRATDRAGNVGDAASYSWTIDQTAPDSAIGVRPPDPSSSSSATFELAGTDNHDAPSDLRFACRLNSSLESDWADCESPRLYTDLSEGRHTLELRARDRAGNVDATPASYSWRIDVTKPVTTIASGPADPTNATSAILVFSADEEASFQCRLDGGDYSDCESPHPYELLAEGRHTFEVRATDRAGNVGEAASYSWTVDLTAPVTTIDAKPADPTNNTSATFEFSAGEDASFECKLDLGDYAACTSPQRYGPLGDGEHTFQVRATDRAGNQGAAASYTWTVDTVAPETVLDDRPPATTTSTSATFTFSSEAGATFECKLDTQTFGGCESPKQYPDLAVGEHRFEVRAKDAAGNVDGSPASYVWTVEPPDNTPPDTTVPETAITSAGPADPTNQTAASFSFTGSDDVSAPTALRFQCRLDSAAEAGWEGCSSPKSYGPLAEGRHTFEVRAIDAAGNDDRTPDSRSWTIDTTAPETTIDSGPSGLTSDATPTYTFSSEPGASFQCRVGAAPFAACTSPHTTAALADGAHTFEVRAADAAGNVDGSAASRAITVDTVAPQTTIDSGPAGLTNDSTPTYAFSSEPGASFQCRVDTGAFAACTSPHTTAALTDGAHTIEVRATDAAGNADASPASRAITVDTAAPQTTIDSGPSGLTNDPTPTYSFSSEPGAGFQCRVDSGSFTPCSSPHTTAALAEGAHTFEVRATDGAGNIDGSPASRAVTVDTVAPQTTIDAGPSGLTNDATPTYGFSSEPGAGFQCRLDSGAFAACTSPHTTAALADGAHTFEVRATDAAGNVDGSPASRAITVDTTAPQTTIDSGPSGATNDNTPTYTFSSEPGAGLQCRVDAAPFAACTSPHSTAALTDGAHTFEVRATDAAGNTDTSPASRTITVDTTAPETTIGDRPPATTTSTSAMFAFSSEAGATFECALDAAAFAACTSPTTYTGLGVGTHQFEVRARDAAGNTDASAATYTWTVQSAGACAGPSTVTAASNADSWVLQDSASNNYGNDSVVKVDTKSGANARALFRFTLPAIPSGCRITSATLRLYASSYKEGRTIQALRLGAAWTESGVNWNNQPATTGAAATASSPSASTHVQWSVASQVEEMYSGGNHGFLIRDSVENGNGVEQAFHSREKGTDNPPQLVITFG